MIISPAFAQAAPSGDPGYIGLLPIVLMFVLLYFLLIRPQQKKMKAHREMISAVKRGDRVLTAGGIFGTVVKLEEGEDVVLVEIAKDIRVRVARGTISDVLTKPQPAGQAQKTEAVAGQRSGLMSQLFGKK